LSACADHAGNGHVVVGRVLLRGEVVDEEMRLRAFDFGDAERGFVNPLEPLRRGGAVGGYVFGFASAGGDDVDVAAGYPLVGHEAADEGDFGAVGGEAREGDLEAVERAGCGVPTPSTSRRGPRGVEADFGFGVEVGVLGVELDRP